MARDELDLLSSFKQLLFLNRQALKFNEVLDIQSCVVLVSVVEAKGKAAGLGLNVGGLHLDGCLLYN